MDIYDLIMEKMNKKEELDDKDFRQLIDSDTPYEIEDYKYLISEILNNYHISDFMADELIFKLRHVIELGNYRFENEDKDTFFLNQVLNLYYDYIKPDPKDAGVLYRLARRAYNKDEYNELSSQTYLNFVGIIFDMCNFEYIEDISDVLFCAKSKIFELQYANDENAEEFKAKYRDWITQILQNNSHSLSAAESVKICEMLIFEDDGKKESENHSLEEVIVSSIGSKYFELNEAQKSIVVKSVLKGIINESDLPPCEMVKLFDKLNDEEFTYSYIQNNPDINLNLKYALLSRLTDKTLFDEFEESTLFVTDLSEINLEELEKGDRYKYIQICDSERDVINFAYGGISEIYSKEEMINILKKANEILADIPYPKKDDLIEETIVFKKIYEKYVQNTVYDEDAIKDDMKDDWRRQIRCRSLGGAILDGLAVCSGDAFGLKNLLAMRGIKAYVTHGEIKSLNDDGHAWNTIRLGGNYYKFDGTVEREDTLKNGTLSLQAVKKEHGINDDYNNMFAVRQSYEAIYDEQSSKQGKRKDSLAQEFD